MGFGFSVPTVDGIHTAMPTDVFALFALLWLAPFNPCRTDQLPPPGNVSLSWVTDFCYRLSWAAPVKDPRSCVYHLFHFKEKVEESRLDVTKKHEYAAMVGGVLEFNLSAHCGGLQSPLVNARLAFPELVMDFQCILHSRSSLNCTWRSANHSADVRLYYRVVESFGGTEANCGTTYDLVECAAYQRDGGGGGRTGCILREDFYDPFVWFQFNATVNGTLARNTFQKDPRAIMQPPAVNWTGEEGNDSHNLTMRWTPVDLPGHWEYYLSYTACGKKSTLPLPPEPYPFVLPLESCAINITMWAINSDGRDVKTPPGPYRVYGKNTNPNTPLILACTLLPAVVVVLMVVTLVCFRRHRESIFPQVPEPQDFLPDMLMNNNNKKVMYVPAPEDEPQNVQFDIRA